MIMVPHPNVAARLAADDLTWATEAVNRICEQHTERHGHYITIPTQQKLLARAWSLMVEWYGQGPATYHATHLPANLPSLRAGSEQMLASDLWETICPACAKEREAQGREARLLNIWKIIFRHGQHSTDNAIHGMQVWRDGKRSLYLHGRDIYAHEEGRDGDYVYVISGTVLATEILAFTRTEEQ